MAKFTSPFATANTSAEDVSALIEQGLDHMASNGDIEWSELDTPIGYSRGWLIVRRAYLEQNQPTALVTLPTDTDPVRQQVKQSKVVNRMRNEDQLSWGEISVRLGIPESRVRAIYRSNDTKKDLGLRIGKGGRFAYDDPTLYLDNRKKEGAWIPVEKRGKPLVEELMNYVADAEQAQATQGTSDARKRAAIKGKITKLMAKANDPAVTPEEREAFLAKVDELRKQYNIAA